MSPANTPDSLTSFCSSSKSCWQPCSAWHSSSLLRTMIPPANRRRQQFSHPGLACLSAFTAIPRAPRTSVCSVSWISRVQRCSSLSNWSRSAVDHDVPPSYQDDVAVILIVLNSFGPYSRTHGAVMFTVRHKHNIDTRHSCSRGHSSHKTLSTADLLQCHRSCASVCSVGQVPKPCNQTQ